MASLPPLNSITDYHSLSASKNAHILFTFDLSSLKRHRFSPFSSSRDSSSSAPSSSSYSSDSRRKSTNLYYLTSDKRCRFSIKAKNDLDLVNSVSAGNQDKYGSKRKKSTLIKALFRKKSVWRKVLFSSRKVRSIVLLNFLTFVYASNIPVVKEIEAIVDPATFTVVRFAVSAFPFIPFVIRAWPDAQTRNAGIELGFWVSLGYLMQALGLMTSDAGRASFISMFTVIVVPLLDGMLGAVVPARTWFGALMSILGVGMLESSGSPPCIGDLLNFLSAVFFGIHMLRTEHISRSTSKKDFLPVLGYEICVIAIFSTIWYLVESQFDGAQTFDPSSWTWTMIWHWTVSFPWIPAIYTGVFSTALCLWIEMAAMCDISATETAIIYGLEPVWGAAFAWFLLGERWGVAGWIGAALVLVGSLTVQIFGSSALEGSNENEEKGKNSEKQKGFSTSPVPIHCRKNNVSDVLKK